VQNKHSIESNDIGLVGDTMSIYEPIDTTQLLSFIDIAHSKYIRIAYDEMPDALFA
jgi:hypothetical protein